jgi:hypothetical protein
MENMKKNEFNALSRGLRPIPENKNPGASTGAGTDASAIHGRRGAQVALLQSPILPAASPSYKKRKPFPGFPVDKPHTRISRLISPSLPSLRYAAASRTWSNRYDVQSYSAGGEESP